MTAGYYASSSLKNVEAVQAMGMESNVLRRWLKTHFHAVESQSRAAETSSILSQLSKGLRILFQSLILGLGAYLVLQNEVTPGMMIAASIILGRALAPVDALIGSWKGFVSARSAYQRVDELFACYPDTEQAMSLPRPKGRLSVEGVAVAPPLSQQLTLKSIDFRLEPGEVLAVVGPSGAGKSSLARAILGIWGLQAGKVRLDSADIHRWDRDELGSALGYLPQHIELFEGTVAENIARLGEVDAKKVVVAAKMAGVHDLILRLPQGYETPLTGQDGGLSAGQRQRIGLARALYGKPTLVVLDEPNAHLDEQGERALMHTIEALRIQKVTTVLISHRKAILSQVDKLLVLSQGEMRVFGTRDSVLLALQKGQIEW
jgi:ATP-binding cassette subfamily C protein EexD